MTTRHRTPRRYANANRASRQRRERLISIGVLCHTCGNDAATHRAIRCRAIFVPAITGYPTSRLTEAELAEGWTMCQDALCRAIVGERKIIGPHAHLVRVTTTELAAGEGERD